MKLYQLVLAAWVCLLASVSCSSDDTATASTLAEGCVVNTDCSSPLVCAFRKCHVACTTSRDCQPGQRCMLSDRPFHVCQLEDERECIYNSDCPGGEVCGVDLECRDKCVTDRDCVKEQTCVGGTCADPNELVAGKLTVKSPDGGGDAPAGQPCVYTSECPPPLACNAGTCAVECKTPADCQGNRDCVNNRCIEGSGTLIGPQGGMVSAASGKVTLTVPPAALRSSVSVAIQPLDAWPAGALGPVFEILPTGLIFDVPATLTFHYAAGDIGAVAPGDVRVALAVGTKWMPLVSTVDPAARTASAALQHLSVYGLVSKDLAMDAGAPDGGTGGAGGGTGGAGGVGGVGGVGGGTSTDSGVDQSVGNDAAPDTGPAVHVGDLCLNDGDCAGIVGATGVCSNDAFATGTDDPTPVCMARYATASDVFNLTLCDGTHGIELGFDCYPACTIDASGGHGCRGKDTCMYAGYTTSPSLVAYGFCWGGCTTNQDCTNGETCQIDLGYCRNAANTYVVSSPVGATCDPSATSPVCNCEGRAMVHNLGTICTSACALGGNICPQGFACDSMIPSIDPSTGQPLFAAIGTAGVWGNCAKACTTDADCVNLGHCELHAGMGSQKTCDTDPRYNPNDAGTDGAPVDSGVDSGGPLDAGASFDCTGPITFPDPALETVVGNIVDDIGPFTQQELNNVTDLTAQSASVANLSGIQCMTNLHTISMSNNQISDITPLAALVNLTQLTLMNNQITSLAPLAGLPNLYSVYLSNNQIADVSPLVSMPLLTNVDVSDNPITNLSLLGQNPRILNLSAYATNLSDLSWITGLTQFRTLHIGGNPITDITPLTGLYNLIDLDLSNTGLTDLTALSALEGLEYLTINNVAITDASFVAGMTGLQYFSLIQGQLTSLAPFAGLTQLQVLQVDQNPISDLSPLSDLTNLTSLNLSQCQVVDLSPIAYIASIQSLGVTYDLITDLSPLVSGTVLSSGDTVYLQGNPLDCAAQASNLAAVRANGVQVYTDCLAP